MRERVEYPTTTLYHLQKEKEKNALFKSYTLSSTTSSYTITSDTS